jgi:hypothetical protein
VNEARRQAAEDIEDEISSVANPVLDVIPEDIKKPYVSKKVKESSVKKQGSEKREELLEGCKRSREIGMGIPCRNNSIEKKCLFKMGPLDEFPKKSNNIQDDDQDVDDRKFV